MVVSGRTPVTEKVSGQVIESTGLGIYGADELGLAIDTEIGMLTVANRPCPEGVSAAEQSLADCLSHQQRLDAISAGNIEGALIGMADDIDLFMPNFDPKDPVLQVHIGNQSAYREYLNDLFLRYRIEESNVVNRLTTETWIFSEMAWIFVDKESGERLLVRYALVEALTLDGKVRSCVGVAVSD